MSVSGVNGINGAGSVQNTEKVDRREIEVASKLVTAGLISSVQDFLNMSESQKHLKIEEYNKTHPNDPIGHKGTRGEVNPQESKNTESTQGSTMSKFMNDIDWKKIKLE